MSERSGRRLQGRPPQRRQGEPDRRQRERADLQHQAEHSRPRRPALAGYLVVLFAVAFLLLLLAYFQQQRQSNQAADNALKQSTSAVQSIQTLMEESKALREENEALKEQVDALVKDHESLKEQYLAEAAGHSQQEAAVAAMDYFWQIDEAYVRQRYTLCKQLIQELKDSGYESALPDTKATANDRFSPAARYQEIYDALY